MARIPENPLPATLQRLPDGTVQPVTPPEQLHLHQDQIVHHHYPQPQPSTGAQIGVALANALAKAAPGLGWSLGGGAILIIGGGMLGMVLISLAIAALCGALAVHAVAGSITNLRKPAEHPKHGKRR